MKAKLTNEQKEANKLARIDAEKNQPEVKELTITIEWKRSRTWGNCPRAYAEIRFKNGGFERTDSIYYASGWGYDKESTVIAQIFNEFMKHKLWKLGTDKLRGGNGSMDKGDAPYGIHLYSEDTPHFGGGIGTSCYYRIAEYLGGKFEHIASGKTFDVYKYSE